MIVNHVMSNDVNSGIFNDIMRYFTVYSSDDVEIVVSNKPVSNADVYHYHRPHLEEKLKSPSVCTVHHDLNETDNWLDYNKFDPVYRAATRVICLNTEQKKFLSARNIKNTIVIPHGYNPNIFPCEKEFKVKEVEKVTLGLVSKRYGRKVKGEEYIYELVKYLSPTDFKFILVGEGRSYDAEIIRKLGFDVKVFEFLPYVMFDSLYSEIDLLLMTSYHEGGPANIPEAVATGTPIAGNPIGMVADYLVDGENGFMLTMDPAVDYLCFLNYKNNMYDYKLSAYKKINTAITWKSNIDLHMDLYKKLADERVQS